MDTSTTARTSVGSTPSSVRISNLALVLRAVLGSSRPVSRADVASQLGMTRSTVSRLVDELVAGRFLAEGLPVSGPRGRPGVPLAAAAHGLASLGMEVNADRIAAMVVDLSGAVLATRAVEIDVIGAGPVAALGVLQEQALAVLGSLPDGARIVGAHLAIPALVDRAGAVVLRAPNLGWDGVEPAHHLEELLNGRDWDFRVSNDVDCSALTLLHDAPLHVRDRGSFIYVTGEVGIGSSVVIDGQQMTGRHGWASELGHVCVVSEGGLPCGCGATGCLETVAGLHGLLERSATSSIEAMQCALNDSDPRALDTIAAAARALGRALGAALNLLDLEQVVLGGHLGTLSPWLLPDLRTELSVRVLWSPYEEIDIATVGQDPTRTALGAAYAALGPVVSNPGRFIDRDR
ncbi:MAG: ROK family transcriptional regulator [Propionibacteriaceae bacterium]|nr:ROK family transcriptional regulator [Propionibacteriaceae bacterium]